MGLRRVREHVQEILGNSDPNRKPISQTGTATRSLIRISLRGRPGFDRTGARRFWHPSPHWMTKRNTVNDLKGFRHNPEIAYLDFSNSRVSTRIWIICVECLLTRDARAQ